VEINGVPSACAAASPAACTFSYSASATPSVSSVSPATVALQDQAATVTITGTGLSAVPDHNSVTVGGMACGGVAVTGVDAASSSLATELQCVLSRHTPSGTWPVVVQVEGRGQAISAAQLTVSSLWIAGASPPALPANATVLLNITGGGFDLANCSRHAVTVAGRPAGVASCGPGYLTVLASTPGADAAGGLLVTVSLFDPPSNATYTASLANSTLGVSAALPRITAAAGPATAALAGGNLDVQLSGDPTAASIASLQLVRAFAPLPLSPLGAAGLISAADLAAAAAAALAAPLPCLDVSAGSSPGAFRCSLGAVPRGSYYPLLSTYSSAAGGGPLVTSLFAQEALAFELAIESVEPGQGSIGGGTLLTLSGSGFSSAPGANVVLLRVPPSSTHPSGVVLCDVEGVVGVEGGSGASRLTCRTRPHLAADASADDPDARAVEPVATGPGCAALWLAGC
jgi:hypothetical protein